MAKGDVVADVQDISSGANLDFQPGSGVEVRISELAGEATIISKMIDGSLVDAIDQNLTVGEDREPSKLLINNGHYLRVTEGSGNTFNIGYSGVQTK